MAVGKFVLDEFTIDKNVKKKGGEAIVSKAWHPRFGQVAIKEWTSGAYGIDNEIELLIENCDHPNIIQFLGILMNNESKCIGYIIPYMFMGSLDDVIHNKAKKYDEKQISSWITQICCGLSHLHFKNIIHRDIKPNNVLLGKCHDDVKLSDFGMARSLKSINHTLTQLGTPLYMAPEIFKRGNYDFSADIYSLAITIWEILHRRCWHSDTSKRPKIDYVREFSMNIRFLSTSQENSIPIENNKETILLLGGWNGGELVNNLLILQNNEEDDGNWKELNIKLPYAVGSHGAQFLNNNLYIFGGVNEKDEILNSSYKLTRSRKWLTSSLKWKEINNMNEKRIGIQNSSVILNDRIWVIGGIGKNNTLKSVEMYDPKITIWTNMKSMNEYRSYAAAAVVYGKIFCCGGHNGYNFVKSAECYDPSSDAWTLISDMPRPNGACGIVVVDAHLIVIGGKASEEDFLSGVWVLDTDYKNAEWIETSSMSFGRCQFSIAKIDGKILVCGGEYIEKKDSRPYVSNGIEIFDGQVWKNGPHLASYRTGAAAVVIPMEFARSLN